MKMSVTNTGRRRLSMLSFTGLFTLAISLSCLAFMKSMGLKDTLPRQELKELKEKEKVLASFAQLSQALGRYEDAQRADASSANKEFAECREKSGNLHTILKNRDTTRTYQDVSHFLNMADRYFLSIKQLGNETDGKIKIIEEELTRLRNRNNALQAEKNSLQTTSSSLQLEKTTLSSQLAMAKMKNKEGSGGTPTEDCTLKVNEYKSGILQIVQDMQTNLVGIQTQVSNISGFLGIGKHKKEKESIETNLKELENNLMKLQNQ